MAVVAVVAVDIAVADTAAVDMVAVVRVAHKWVVHTQAERHNDRCLSFQAARQYIDTQR